MTLKIFLVMKLNRINIIGINPCKRFSDNELYCINNSDVIFSGRRNINLLNNIDKNKIEIMDINKFLIQLNEYFNDNKKITVIASGDPLFYGIGKLIIDNFDKRFIDIIPNIGTLQIAMAKIKEEYNDIKVISLHGRPIKGLAQKIRCHNKIFLFTDKINSPSNIAKYLLDFNLNNFTAYVFENLGYKNEKIGKYNINDLINMEFSDLNAILLKKYKDNTISLDDNNFIKKNNNITKKEIRNIDISEMDIKNNSTIWDIGSGTGSISIEASFSNKDGKIYSIEKDVESYNNIIKNMKGFSTDLEVINGEAPAILYNITDDPDIVFIGGSSSKIESIIEYSHKRLKSNGIIIVNTTTIENMVKAYNKMKKLDMYVNIKQINVSRSRDINNLTRFAPLNQVYVVKGVKNE